MEKTFIPANNYEQAAKELEAVSKGLSQKLSKEIDQANNGHFTVALVRSSDNPVSKKYDHKVNIQQLNKRAFEKMENNLAVTGFDKMIIVHNPDPSHSRKTVKSIAQQNIAAVVETPAQIEARLRTEFEAKFAGFVPGTQVNEPAAPMAVVGAPVETIEQMEERLRTEFELRFGPGTDPEKIQTDDFIAMTQDGATLKINFSNSQVFVDDADDAEVTMIGDFSARSTVAQLEQFATDNSIDLTGVTGKDNILSALTEWKNENVK